MISFYCVLIYYYFEVNITPNLYLIKLKITMDMSPKYDAGAKFEIKSSLALQSAVFPTPGKPLWSHL